MADPVAAENEYIFPYIATGGKMNAKRIKPFGVAVL